MIERRVGALIRNLSGFYCHSFVPFSSSSMACRPRCSNIFADDAEEGSSVYRHALKFQRPTTIKWQNRLENSFNLIGAVVRPCQAYKNPTSDSGFGIYTLLSVKDPLWRNREFWILLEMWNDLAKLYQNHLKQDDYIYVSGPLSFYTRLDQNGGRRVNYKVIVRELNYVAKHGCGVTHQKSTKSKSGEESCQAGLKKYDNRNHLWQLYFANPYDWWDNRETKRYPGSPDFKHKDTGEAIWLSPNDPPWVKKQLQQLDSKMVEQGLNGYRGRRARISSMVYDELFEDFSSSC